MLKIAELMDFFQEITCKLGAPFQLEQILEIISSHFREALGLKAAGLKLFDRHREKMVIHAGSGFSREYLEKGDWNMESALLKIREGNPMVFRDITADSICQFPAKMQAEGIKSAVLVPIRINDEIIGVLTGYTGEFHDFDEEEIESAVIFANLAALAIEQSVIIHRTRTLHEIGMDLSSLDDLSELIKHITKSVGTAMGVKGCSIQLFDRKRKSLITCLGYGLSSRFLEKENINSSQLIPSILRGERLAIYDTATDESIEYREAAKNEGIASLLAVPLKAESEIIGAMRVYTAYPHNFSDKEIEFLETVAYQGAASIRNARRLNRMHFLKNLGKMAVSTWDPEEVLDRITQSMIEVMDVRSCFLLGFDRECKYITLEVYNGMSEELASRLRLSDELLFKQVFGGKPFQVEQKRMKELLGESYKDVDIGTMLSAPLVIEGRVTGTLNVVTAYSHVFSPEDEEFLKTVASYCAIVLENYRALARERFLLQALELANNSGDTEEVSIKIISDAAEALNMNACYVNYFTGGGKYFTFSGEGNFETREISLPLEANQFVEKIMANGGINIEEEQIAEMKDLNCPGEAMEGVKSAYMAPIIHRDKQLGVLGFLNSAPTPFSMREIDFASSTANLLAIILGQAIKTVISQKGYSREL